MKVLKTLLLSGLMMGSLAGNFALAAEQNGAPEADVKQTQPVAEPQSVAADKLNINSATASEISKSLIGIGAKKAEAIVQYREKHGNFTEAEQLLEVQGIGKATLDKNRDRLSF
ncbi:competence protein ComE [Actinobacillus succinogenes]|uniref:Competence protein ComEA helix-hairpin-helix repeat protein n=1 Tax=Actinobacillus succinogenes (strain ATCC 55618 / DSM 22257 / CCUG 43843 / 130Z) TaxID=339671 RepID=A6VQH7_ACTSZ|nr:helix-hairpin-helix domain-containing protein [Actinobacillus succinogenes]ABR75224.1 competence protein ComEA helix-hairpin-helix repeat protein [Actinobacillus succinogenes 130Z]PHI40383.1 competence protein ComE [Actinobacillus succinogenes]